MSLTEFSEALCPFYLEAAIPSSHQKSFLYLSQLFPEKLAGKTKVWDAERKALGNSDQRGTSAGTSSKPHIQELQGLFDQAMILPPPPTFLSREERLSFTKPEAPGKPF